MSGPSLLRRRKRRRRRLLLGQGSILLNLILLYWTYWCRFEKLVERSSLLHFSCWYSELFDSRLSRLSEHFEASESISPIRSISLAFGLSSLLPPVRVCHCACHLRSFLSSSDYPLITICAFPVCSFPHLSATFLSVSSGCWPYTCPLSLPTSGAVWSATTLSNFFDRTMSSSIALLSFPVYPLFSIIAFSVCSFPHLSAISLSVLSGLLAAESPHTAPLPM